MEYIYMEAYEHHNGHITWMIHKTKKGAINAAKVSIRCGAKTAKVYAISGMEIEGWFLRLDLEPTIENLGKWKLIAEFKEEAEQ